jgi:hypothetical protein
MSISNTASAKTCSQIVGVDFTSAPSWKKPITWATGFLDPTQKQLIIQTIDYFEHFEAFEAHLKSTQNWFGAFDFPFGQAESWLRQAQLPLNWSDSMAYFDSLRKVGFEALIKHSMARSPVGEKLHFRPTDRVTRSSSPMKLFYPPVGKMFYEGARRLWQADVSVLPCRELPDAVCRGRYAVEGYPALVARYCLKDALSQSYKSDDSKKDSPDKRAARQTIVDTMFKSEFAAGLQNRYGVSLVWACEVDLEKTLIAPCSADALDAVLCCLQAAYSYGQGPEGLFGIPNGVNPNEGWIVDPSVNSELL